MKRKIILVIVVFVFGFLVWGFAKISEPRPIEIAANSLNQSVQDATSNQSIQGKAQNQTVQDATLENLNEEIDASTEASMGASAPPEKSEPAQNSANDSFIINKKVSWGYSSSSGRTIDTIVFHSSYDALGDDPYNLDGLIAEYKQYGVAPHFLIDRKGKIYRLVDEKNIAYHAGVSKTPDGRTEVNNFSIGIEMMNTKEDDFTSKQYSALNDLIDYLENKYNIKYVLGHEDISPDRKTDPWNFDWDEVESKKSIH